MDRVTGNKQCDDSSVTRTDHVVDGPVPVDLLREVYTKNGTPFLEKQTFKNSDGKFAPDGITVRAILNDAGKFTAMKQSFGNEKLDFTTFKFEGKEYLHIDGPMAHSKSGFYVERNKITDPGLNKRLQQHLDTLNFNEPKC